MKKFIFTENQIKKIIDSQINEQSRSAEDIVVDKNKRAHDDTYNNIPISQQMKKYSGSKFGFSQSKIKELDGDKANKLYQVKAGDTISGIVKKLGANSEEDVLRSNDMLKGNPKGLQVGMVIVYNTRPSGI